MVLVGAFARRIDTVDIQIDCRFDHLQTVDSSLFRRLSQCNPGQIGVAIGVTTGLQPALQLTVVQHQDAVVDWIDDQCGPRQVTWPTTPLKRIGIVCEECQYSFLLGTRRCCHDHSFRINPLALCQIGLAVDRIHG